MTIRDVMTGALLALLLTGGLSACGQKGDLYLPGENPNPPTPLFDDDNGDDAPLAAPVESKTSEEDSDTPDTNDDDGF